MASVYIYVYIYIYIYIYIKHSPRDYMYNPSCIKTHDNVLPLMNDVADNVRVWVVYKREMSDHSDAPCTLGAKYDRVNSAKNQGLYCTQVNTNIFFAC